MIRFDTDGLTVEQNDAERIRELEAENAALKKEIANLKGAVEAYKEAISK